MIGNTGKDALRTDQEQALQYMLELEKRYSNTYSNTCYIRYSLLIFEKNTIGVDCLFFKFCLLCKPMQG